MLLLKNYKDSIITHHRSKQDHTIQIINLSTEMLHSSISRITNHDNGLIQLNRKQVPIFLKALNQQLAMEYINQNKFTILYYAISMGQMLFILPISGSNILAKQLKHKQKFNIYCVRLSLKEFNISSKILITKIKIRLPEVEIKSLYNIDISNLLLGKKMNVYKISGYNLFK